MRMTGNKNLKCNSVNNSHANHFLFSFIVLPVFAGVVAKALLEATAKVLGVVEADGKCDLADVGFAGLQQLCGFWEAERAHKVGGCQSGEAFYSL